MNHNKIPEEKTGAETTGPPKRYTLSPPEDTARCVGCLYPGVGFICWSPDGSCLRTEVEKLSRQSKGR